MLVRVLDISNGPANEAVCAGWTARFARPVSERPGADEKGPFTVWMPSLMIGGEVPVIVVVPSKGKFPSNTNKPPVASQVPSVEEPPATNASMPLCDETVPVLWNGTSIPYWPAPVSRVNVPLLENDPAAPVPWVMPNSPLKRLKSPRALKSPALVTVPAAESTSGEAETWMFRLPLPRSSVAPLTVRLPTVVPPSAWKVPPPVRDPFSASNGAVAVMVADGLSDSVALPRVIGAPRLRLPVSVWVTALPPPPSVPNTHSPVPVTVLVPENVNAPRNSAVEPDASSHEPPVDVPPPDAMRWPLSIRMVPVLARVTEIV